MKIEFGVAVGEDRSWSVGAEDILEYCDSFEEAKIKYNSYHWWDDENVAMIYAVVDRKYVFCCSWKSYKDNPRNAYSKKHLPDDALCTINIDWSNFVNNTERYLQYAQEIIEDEKKLAIESKKYLAYGKRQRKFLLTGSYD